VHAIPDRYPIPHIEDFAQTLYKKQVFSTTNLIRAYNQIPMNPEDIPKTVVTTPFRLYEFRFMPFGLCNAAQTFQRFINEVLHGLSYCYVYIDDILIASSNEEEHKAHLQELFSRLDAYGVNAFGKVDLKINLAKCILGESEIQFLDYKISADDTRPPPEKVEV